MKLFLASSLDKTLPLLQPLLTKKPGELNVLFIANAADPYSEKFWVDWDRAKFIELGYKIIEIDLRNVSADEFSKALDGSQILHGCGGSVYYLIDLIRKQNLEQIIIDAVKNEKVIYTGTSAGSIVVSASIAAFSYDEEEMEYIKKVPDKRGLGLINFAIVSHCNQEETREEHKKIIDHMPQDPTALIFLQDNQAVIVENDKIKIVSI